MKAIHLTTALNMLNSPEPVDLKVWNKWGELLDLKNCIGLKAKHYIGVRNVKCLTSGEIRRIRDILIYEINGLKVFI